MSRLFYRAMIKKHTHLTRAHLTPEIPLHLITPDTRLWQSTTENCPFDDPFWGFYWPGSQALARYILDNPVSVRGKSILEIGSGCGAASIAAKLSGASEVMANDIDPVSLVAIAMNSEENDVECEVSDENLLEDTPSDDTDVVLMGDMFYDPEFAELVNQWIERLSSDTVVLVGDPGRLPFLEHPLKKKMRLAASYELLASCRSENNGLTHGSVWEYDKSNNSDGK